MRCRAVGLVTAGLLFFAGSSEAARFLPHKHAMSVTEKVAYFKRSVRKDQTAIAFLTSRHAPRTLERRSELGWYREALRWHTRLLARYSAKLLPSPREYAGSCLASIIDREDPGWSPTQWNSQGSGAYGLPQARPASKMAKAGTDWRTNPYTQIRWAHIYAVERYGGDCEAWAHWQAAQQW